ncbi:uroporphyrinogen decarboxylase family protein [Sporolactobacillus putidus]|uniref:Uroporphyrinogen decarboxylase (URO-D) domain-containing protein n=1 Tax=Sporolactobacillus putidus TaxID=492735 RepID=A0A917S3X4_9BACL|nr:uroporphyrinogen decarboxylase family protein [Sporolactobacillus putidus]GGL51746.1 hypothetical protein GCM10007968_14870 [Sporolactobacillus putidus]
MNRFERIKAALNFEDVDRIPVNLWMHFSAYDQNPKLLAEKQVAYARKYDFDFIKLAPFGLYGVEDWGVEIEYFNKINRPPAVKQYAIESIDDWTRLEVLPAIYGTYGKQLQLSQHVAKLSKGEFPFVQTIFSPLTTAHKLAGDRLFLDIRENPAIIKQALDIITETTINFVKANIEAGVSGFFFATKSATRDLFTETEYKEFGVPYDLKVIHSYNKQTFFNIAHIHGPNNLFHLIAAYPVNCLNWHDRWVSPSLAEARKITDKCLLGGIREVPYFDEHNRIIRKSLLVDGSVNEVENHVREAIREVDGKGLILGPGCVADQEASEKNIYAVRRASVFGSPKVVTEATTA